MLLFSHRNQGQLSEMFRRNLSHDRFQGRSFLCHRKNRNQLGTYTANMHIQQNIKEYKMIRLRKYEVSS